mmetsp:Transcript_56618/g.184146  ORF Transcript_56618/g.184146 Transcript_56618/m.184146 type:complete len:278 (+) Transcript_56618:342-1175(+)
MCATGLQSFTALRRAGRPKVSVVVAALPKHLSLGSDVLVVRFDRAMVFDDLLDATQRLHVGILAFFALGAVEQHIQRVHLVRPESLLHQPASDGLIHLPTDGKGMVDDQARHIRPHHPCIQAEVVAYCRVHVNVCNLVRSRIGYPAPAIVEAKKHGSPILGQLRQHISERLIQVWHHVGNVILQDKGPICSGMPCCPLQGFLVGHRTSNPTVCHVVVEVQQLLPVVHDREQSQALGAELSGDCAGLDHTPDSARIEVQAHVPAVHSVDALEALREQP